MECGFHSAKEWECKFSWPENKHDAYSGQKCGFIITLDYSQRLVIMVCLCSVSVLTLFSEFIMKSGMVNHLQGWGVMLSCPI